MERRDFLRYCGLASLGASMAPGFSLRASAQSTKYDGPYWIFVHAGGGYDPRFLFDPTDRKNQNTLYTDTAKVGAITAAGWDVDPAAMNLDEEVDYGEYLLSPRQFLERLGDRLTVVNGLDMTTNNHDTGTRAAASGQLVDGFPALGALIARDNGPQLPLAFVGGGGYDATGGIVPVARVGSVDALLRLAYTNRLDASDPDSRTYHSKSAMARIRAAQKRRVGAAGDNHLPTVQKAVSDLELARKGDGALRDLDIPDLIDLPGGLNDEERLIQQGQIVTAAFKAGIGVSATISLGGFDTHGNHNRDQSRQLAKLLGGIYGIHNVLKAEGLANKTYMVVTSDFARGPFYNEGQGKDHWPVSSMMAMGPGIQGNRVVGATDADQRAREVDPETFQPAKGGVVIDPSHVHQALRKLAGVSDSADESGFALAADTLPLFG